MAVLSHLVDFAAPVQAPAPVRVEDLPGYAEGFAAARAQIETDTAKEAAALADALEALVRTEEAARRDVARSLAPVFDAIGRHLLPETAPQALIAQVAAYLAQTADVAGDDPVTMRCAPGDLDRLQSCLPARLKERVTLIPDPELAPLCVVLGLPGWAETVFDRGAMIARVAILFDAFFDHLTESDFDG